MERRTVRVVHQRTDALSVRNRIDLKAFINGAHKLVVN
jgi:hypothetical protein